MSGPPAAALFVANWSRRDFACAGAFPAREPRPHAMGPANFGFERGILVDNGGIFGNLQTPPQPAKTWYLTTAYWLWCLLAVSGVVIRCAGSFTCSLAALQIISA